MNDFVARIDTLLGKIADPQAEQVLGITNQQVLVLTEVKHCVQVINASYIPFPRKGSDQFKAAAAQWDACFHASGLKPPTTVMGALGYEIANGPKPKGRDAFFVADHADAVFTKPSWEYYKNKVVKPRDFQKGERAYTSKH